MMRPQEKLHFPYGPITKTSAAASVGSTGCDSDQQNWWRKSTFERPDGPRFQRVDATHARSDEANARVDEHRLGNGCKKDLRWRVVERENKTRHKDMQECRMLQNTTGIREEITGPDSLGDMTGYWACQAQRSTGRWVQVKSISVERASRSTETIRKLLEASKGVSLGCAVCSSLWVPN